MTEAVCFTNQWTGFYMTTTSVMKGLIPPILISNKLISKFKEKANYLNAFFAFQFTPISNNSTLLLLTTPVTNPSLSSVSFNDQDILKIIHSLNINEAHEYDDISIRLYEIIFECIYDCLLFIFYLFYVLLFLF